MICLVKITRNGKPGQALFSVFTFVLRWHLLDASLILHYTSCCRYFGTVIKVNAESSNTSQCSIIVKYDDGTISDSMQYPAPDIEKLTANLERFPEKFVVGDVVEAQFQNGKSKGQWYRGRIANVNEDGKTCDIMYYDKDVSVAVLACLLSFLYFVWLVSHKPASNS